MKTEYPFVVNNLPLGWRSDAGQHSIGFTPKQSKPTARPQLISADGEGHLMTVARTGTGKTRSCAIPALLEYTGPMVVVDVKGELYDVTARRRREMGHHVVRIDPWQVCGKATDGFNPLDILQLPQVDREDTAVTLAAEIVGHSANHQDRFWDETAKGILSGLLAHLASRENREECRISRLRELFNEGDFSATLARLLDSGEVSSVLAQHEFSAFLQHSSGTTRPSVQSSAQHHVQLFGSTPVRAATDLSSFPLQHVIDGEPLTLYFVVPAHKLHSHSNLLRLWVSSITAALATRISAPDERTLLLLDEAGTIGQLESLPMAMSMLRGLGVRVWTLWQDLSQLRKHYPDDWEMLVNNCAAIQLFGASNLRVANDYASLLGDRDGESLLHMERNQAVVLVEGERRSQLLRRVDYLEDAMFRNMFDGNRLHRQGDQLSLFGPPHGSKAANVVSIEPFLKGKRGS
ncbi:MAG: type IV secretory system conjugative DNA transfer family protein [Granulosicoccaceae bacterium]